MKLFDYVKTLKDRYENRMKNSRFFSLNQSNSPNIGPRKLTYNQTINILAYYLLGTDDYRTDSLTQEEINAILVFQILMEHSRQFRQEYYYHINRRPKEERRD